jgi:hypothetical protein
MAEEPDVGYLFFSRQHCSGEGLMGWNNKGKGPMVISLMTD